MPLPKPVTSSGAAGLAAIIEDPQRAVLAFDYDGVLSPIVDNPEQARAHPRALTALARLAPHVGAVAIISGRPAAVVLSYCDFADMPSLSDLVIFGHYGRERWDARTGKVLAPPPSAAVQAARAELPAVLARAKAPADVWIEDKGSAVAVHTRRSADPLAAFNALRAPLAALALRHELIVEPGRLVLELRPPGVDKGAVLRSYVTAASAEAVAYAGDDLGDLSAFAVVEELRKEGLRGLKICSGSPEVIEVAKRADIVVDGPSGMAEFLDGLADAINV